uniref:Uncharacterized protein n=1 Tax=Timema cristinae TaxID=61476 RepID=A0A7R9GRU7_TIMCR|nr:unnamed protein product [Timema cristinae]
MTGKTNFERFVLFLFDRRKCEIRGDVDGGKEPKDLTSSRGMFPSAQIKMRYSNQAHYQKQSAGHLSLNIRDENG